MTSEAAMSGEHGNHNDYNDRPSRIVIDYTSNRPGPCFVIFGSLHGDEHGGQQALQRVADVLSTEQPTLRGRIVGVLGNLQAITVKKRFVDRDLNRGWSEEHIARLRDQDPSFDSVEDREQRELADFIDEIENDPNRPLVFLDMHSTSAEGLPFTCMPDTIDNLRIALHTPIPSILGLEETIDGPLLGLLSDRGFAGIIVEGGQHDNPRTVDILESVIWMLLEALGCLREEDMPVIVTHREVTHRERVKSLIHGLPRVLEIKYRHETRLDDGFQMAGGFEHYDEIKRAQVIATDNKGQISSPCDGRVIMPRYLSNSDQGFFIAVDVSWMFVKILFLLRWLRLDRICHWLPGAHRSPDTPDYITVAHWVPEFFVNIIRLLGWRRTAQKATHTVLRRRRVRDHI